MLMPLRRVLVSSLGLWAILACAAVYLLYPPRQKLRFGADLAGGTYITLGVQTSKAVEYELKQLVQSALKGLKKADNLEPRSTRADARDLSMHLSFNDQNEVLKAQRTIEEYYSSRNRSSHDLQFNVVGGTELVVAFSDKKAEIIKKSLKKSSK